MIQTLQRQIRNGSTTPNIGYDISFLQVQTLTAIIGTAIGLPKMAADIFVVELRQKLNTSTNKIKTVQTERDRTNFLPWAQAPDLDLDLYMLWVFLEAMLLPQVQS